MVRLAADQGYEVAQYNLECYDNGDGVRRTLRKPSNGTD